MCLSTWQKSEIDIEFRREFKYAFSSGLDISLYSTGHCTHSILRICLAGRRRAGPSIRCGLCLCNEEKLYLAARKRWVLEALYKFMGEYSPRNEDEVRSPDYSTSTSTSSTTCSLRAPLLRYHIVAHRLEHFAYLTGADDRNCRIGRGLPCNGRPERRVQGARRHWRLRLRHVPEHTVRQLLVCAALHT